MYLLTIKRGQTNLKKKFDFHTSSRHIDGDKKQNSFLFNPQKIYQCYRARSEITFQTIRSIENAYY